jgi:hypothetical protein
MRVRVLWGRTAASRRITRRKARVIQIVGKPAFFVLSLAIASAAVATPYVEPCNRWPYRDRVEQIMRDSWSDAITPLIISYGSALSTESGIGVARGEDGYRLLRLVFDRSLHYSVEGELPEVDVVDEPGYLRILNAVSIRVAHTSIPISESLATALTEMLESFEAASGDEERGVLIVSTGGGRELVLSDGRCLSLMPRTSPAAEGRVSRLGALTSYLWREMSTWLPNRHEEFESEVLALIEQVDALR